MPERSDGLRTTGASLPPDCPRCGCCRRHSWQSARPQPSDPTPSPSPTPAEPVKAPVAASLERRLPPRPRRRLPAEREQLSVHLPPCEPTRSVRHFVARRRHHHPCRSGTSERPQPRRRSWSCSLDDRRCCQRRVTQRQTVRRLPGGSPNPDAHCRGAESSARRIARPLRWRAGHVAPQVRCRPSARRSRRRRAPGEPASRCSHRTSYRQMHATEQGRRTRALRPTVAGPGVPPPASSPARSRAGACGRAWPCPRMG